MYKMTSEGEYYFLSRPRRLRPFGTRLRLHSVAPTGFIPCVFILAKL